MGFASMAEDMKRIVEPVDVRLKKTVAPLEAGVADLGGKFADLKATVEQLTSAHEKTAAELAEASQFLLVLAELAGMPVPDEVKGHKK
ncbi:hypothetical protein [Streptomyces sp. 5-10]|uniref:hypothetical protein n=1 Tax=Streptomyces sp. 5-10 TaxID=878925 RepID=UPI00168A8FCE|nr:hypothetical protein [Streptomyces sp. 5-10]MBD3004545.1 hypothetical protein [Streptomyces sp. 5-10]